MQELELKVSQQAGIIECNFEEMRTALSVQMSAYLGQEVTEDTIPDYKKDLATLRKIYKAVDAKRTDFKKEYMKPYEEFESNVKTLLAEIDKPIKEIDSQLKVFEEERSKRKFEHCKELYKDNIGDLEKFLPFEKIFNSKWTNATYNDTNIVYDIQEHTVKVKSDLDTIKALHSEIENDCIEAYLRSGNNLSVAISRNTQYLADKQRIEEQTRKEAERAREAEKAREAERAREAEKLKKEKEAELVVKQPEPAIIENKPLPETPPPEVETLDHFVEVIETVHFIVNKEDADKVEQFLTFSNIAYQRG